VHFENDLKWLEGGLELAHRIKNASHIQVEYVFKRFPNEVEKLMQWVKLCEDENKKMIISFKYADPEIKYSHDDNYRNIF